MELPKYININGNKWTVRVQNDNFFGETSGITTYENRTITIKDGLGYERTRIVFNHELIHAINYEFGIRYKHNDCDIVDYFACMFVRFGHLFQKEKEQE